jgi:hypothetical protein
MTQRHGLQSSEFNIPAVCSREFVSLYAHTIENTYTFIICVCFEQNTETQIFKLRIASNSEDNGSYVCFLSP